MKKYWFENDLELLNTIEFIVPGEERPMLQIDKTREKDRLVAQLGTNDGQRALRAARLVENDVAGIDINMGCPKKFSIQGGMGSALLNYPDKVKEVEKTNSSMFINIRFANLDSRNFSSKSFHSCFM